MAGPVTGVAGFIGYHVADALLARGERVLGLDNLNLNAYYDVKLKQARVDRLEARPGFSFRRIDVADREAVRDFVARNPEIDRIVHLAAQAGVRHSLVDPYAYVQSNVMGHLVIQEAARRLGRIEHLVYASSSSVYGANRALPFAETDRVDTPVSVYAATKRADELMSYAYGHLFGLPQTGLRLHGLRTVGPAGHGLLRLRLRDRGRRTDHGLRRRPPPARFHLYRRYRGRRAGLPDRPPDAARPSRVLNIGNHRSERVSALISLLEQALGRAAVIRDVPRPLSDVEETFASVERRIAALTRVFADDATFGGHPALRGLVPSLARDRADERRTGLTSGIVSPTSPFRRDGEVLLHPGGGVTKFCGLRRVGAYQSKSVGCPAKVGF